MPKTCLCRAPARPFPSYCTSWRSGYGDVCRLFLQRLLAKNKVSQKETFLIRPMVAQERQEVAELIHQSTNSWYLANGKDAIFKGPPSEALLFCQVYEDLDPGCCLVAKCRISGRVAGSCFYHPRKTHVSWYHECFQIFLDRELHAAC